MSKMKIRVIREDHYPAPTYTVVFDGPEGPTWKGEFHDPADAQEYATNLASRLGCEVGETPLKRWVGLGTCGNMLYVGRHEDISDAEDAGYEVVWLADEEQARTWIAQLQEILK